MSWVHIWKWGNVLAVVTNSFLLQLSSLPLTDSLSQMWNVWLVSQDNGRDRKPQQQGHCLIFIYELMTFRSKWSRTISWMLLISSCRWGFQSVAILNRWFMLSQLLLVHNLCWSLCLCGLLTCTWRTNCQWQKNNALIWWTIYSEKMVSFLQTTH
jgi:hypothetical protein